MSSFGPSEQSSRRLEPRCRTAPMALVLFYPFQQFGVELVSVPILVLHILLQWKKKVSWVEASPPRPEVVGRAIGLSEGE